jgi:ABC-type dipeptide/oligopeptide/nickel transport system ATPase subunit
MSCQTNEQTTALPPSINLQTPTDILAEQDDIQRQQLCDEADEVDSRDGLVAEATVDAIEVDASGNTRSLVKRENVTTAVVPKISITMPSRSVVEISQNFYWPLYARPIDWILQDAGTSPSASAKLTTRRIAEELHSLRFYQPVPPASVNGTGDLASNIPVPADPLFEATEEPTITQIIKDMQEEKEDWFSDLSGGQKSKVELVRKVFVRDRCPDVLLVDETMAPLDPDSKAAVMAKLKEFCRESVIIVIYHTDVGRSRDNEGTDAVPCVPSNNFFNANIHVEKGFLKMREVC